MLRPNGTMPIPGQSGSRRKSTKSKAIVPKKVELSGQLTVGDSIAAVKISAFDVEDQPTAKDVVVQLITTAGFKKAKTVRFEIAPFSDDTLTTLSPAAFFATVPTSGKILGYTDTVIIGETDSNGTFQCRMTNLAMDRVHLACSPTFGSMALDCEDMLILW